MASSIFESHKRFDVTICGGGPVGLLIAHALARNGITVYVVEQHDKVQHAMYGRAAMLAPRSLEMLEQLDVEEPLGQLGFVTRGQSSYRGATKTNSITYASSNFHDTFIDYLLLIRQTYIETSFRDAFERSGKGSVQYGAKLLKFEIDQTETDYKVRSTIAISGSQSVQISSKYLIGADGSKSSVRDLAGIAFAGSKINKHFIRIDGIIKTNIPNPRQGLISIDSPSHGSILYACLDHGRTRIGFKFPEKMYEELGANISKEDVVREAKIAMQPWKLDFETVDWWTAYSVGQRLAENYQAHDRILIAGDAAHTHSSAAAQGLNLGLHDAVNLAWKLAGHIRGDFQNSVLESYTPERRSHAQKIIDQDRLLGYLHSGEMPPEYRDKSDINREEFTAQLYKENQGLNAGIGITYPPNNPTLVPFTKSSTSTSSLPSLSIFPGERSPDTLLQRPGIRHPPLRLFSLFKNIGKFTVLVFCGDPTFTQSSLHSFRTYLDSPRSFHRLNKELCQYLAIIKAENVLGAPEETLGVRVFGKAYYDAEGTAHERYGIDVKKGFVVILRPDGTVGTGCRLEEGKHATGYFEGFLRVRGASGLEVAEGEKSEKVEAEVEALEKEKEKDLGEVDVQATG